MTARIIPDEQQNYANSIKKLADISYNRALYYECTLTFNFIVQAYSEKYVEQLKKLFTSYVAWIWMYIVNLCVSTSNFQWYAWGCLEKYRCTCM